MTYTALSTEQVFPDALVSCCRIVVTLHIGKATSGQAWRRRVMDEIRLWQVLGISLVLGLLVGLQREWSKSEGAGIRTYPMITMLGTVSALLAERFGGMLLFGGLIGVASLMVMMKVMMNLNIGGERSPHSGPTTGMAALLMYLVGAMLALDLVPQAIAIGGGVALLLQWKRPLHGFVRRIGQPDIEAVFRLVLIAMVVLPVLPDRTYGPYDVLNPFHIWLMVVFIVGISVGSYLVSRLFGSGAGTLISGVLGGLISSTATTISYAGRSRSSPDASPLAAVVIIVASAVVFLRVGFEVAVVAPGVFPQILPQLGVMAGWMILVALLAWAFSRGEKQVMPESEDPSALLPAVMFGALYALVLVIVAAVREYAGEEALYVVALVSGLTDMDAITLSTARLVDNGRLPIDVGWRMMLVGAMSNIVFKGAAVCLLGHPRLSRRIILMFGISLCGGAAILLLWP